MTEGEVRKEFDLASYTPIDYSKWVIGNEARRGINILPFLNEAETKLWNAAVPYQDQRDDPGQGEMVTYFAIKLLDYVSSDRSVAVPAAMFHDTGFYDLGVDWKKIVASGESTEGEARRRPHQNRSIALMGYAFGSLGYSKAHLAKILAISESIGDHDTRKMKPIPEVEGQILRDADYMWRVTCPCSLIYHADKSPEELVARAEADALEQKPPFNLSKIALQMARLEMVNTLQFLHPKDASRALSPKYDKELAIIRSLA